MAEELGNIGRVVHISTSTVARCHFCEKVIGGSDNFESSTEHYMTQHGFRILHIGTETSRTPNGELWHSTVAVLGLDQ
jgi:hypothetical protein